MAVIKLGIVDSGRMPRKITEFLKPYHGAMASALQRRLQLRDEANNAWRSFKEIPGGEVQQLQRFLKENGFFPNARCSGIFGYATMAASRLFQEYVRTVEGKPEIGKPDGIVGPNTWSHINRWKTEGIENKWSKWSSSIPSPENEKWFSILQQAKNHFEKDTGRILNHIREYPLPSDTLPPEHWTLNREEAHLIGIRRNSEASAANRSNDDLFVLLIKGLCFTFWGSTDPNAQLADRSDEAFLVESQHKYRFGWHKVSSATKVYKALRPYSNGVLVYRDKDANNALTGSDIAQGLDTPNRTINIHWSGDGDFNFSAGCQVIAGKSYLNQDGKLVDCRDFASDSYSGLAQGKTRGAYNVLSDLVICYTPLGRDTLWYTLGKEERLNDMSPEFELKFTRDTVEKLKFQK